MHIVPVKTHYLQMLTPSGVPVVAPEEATVVQKHVLDVEEYRHLYRSVGQGWNWVDRLVLTDEELTQIIHHPSVEIHVLHFSRQPAGFVELDCRKPQAVEIAYFGLFPEYTGRGLGRFFLQWAVQRAWTKQPNRVWLHTCELDHPAALPNYLKAGFSIYDEIIIQQPLPNAP